MFKSSWSCLFSQTKKTILAGWIVALKERVWTPLVSWNNRSTEDIRKDHMFGKRQTHIQLDGYF